MKLNVIITTFNDSVELYSTLRSLAACTPPDADFEVIVVDDGSTPPVHIGMLGGNPRFVLHRNDRRIGVGPSRHVGALKASGEFLLLTDSHMRFTPGWYEAAMSRIVNRPTTIHCGCCLGLSAENMNVAAPDGYYWGATWNLFGPDYHNPRAKQIFEPVWATEKPGDDYELSGAMGAIYFISRAWFLKLDPLRFLRSWGGDEASMSLTCWLAGGDIRMLKAVKIGHKFRNQKRAPFRLRTEEIIANKLFTIFTCLPNDVIERMLLKFQRGGHFKHAMKMLFDDWHLVEAQRAYNQTIFTRTFPDFCNHFGFAMP